MAMQVGGNEGESYSDINMTPLIDVMLVLLIIFIITIPVMTHAVKIDNPLPPPPNFVPPPPPEVITLSIDFDGTMMWNGNPVDRKTMQGYIAQEATKDPQPEVHIIVDKFAKYEKVAQTLADLQSHGLKKIGFVNNELF
ncbi:MAG: ExbD/TolR family protein [Steroidobacterales bacterium]